MAAPRICIVDDDASVRESLEGLLESFSFDVAPFESAEALLASQALEGAACVIVDLRMPGMSGLELQATLRARGRPTPSILITAYGDDEIRLRALAAGFVACLCKPFGEERLLAAIRAALGSASGGAGGRA